MHSHSGKVCMFVFVSLVKYSEVLLEDRCYTASLLDIAEKLCLDKMLGTIMGNMVLFESK